MDGYKKGKVIQRDDSWVVESSYGNVDTKIWRQITKNEQLATGRLTWQYVDPTCGINSETKRSMALSICQFSKEFTCDSGRCIKFGKRCDFHKDCNDGSDEKDSTLVQIPDTYKKQLPPESPKSNHAPASLQNDHQKNEEGDSLPIFTTITIINFDKIDTKKLMVGVTADINMKWTDSRLTYENLIDDTEIEKKRIPHGTINR